MGNNLLGVSEVLGTIGSILLAILILLVMITVHEFGHYLAGKLFHFKINEFSIGFGPALFKRKSKKSGELFAIRLIPLGGYCAFEGEDGDEEEKDEAGNVIVKIPDENSFHQKPCWQRIIVLLAGAFMNYLLALVLILVNTLSFGQAMTAVYEVEPTSEFPAEYCLQDRDIFLAVEGKSIYLTTDISLALNGKKKGDVVEMTLSRATERGEDGKVLAREEKTVNVMLRDDVTVESSADTDSVCRALGIRYDAERQTYLLASSFYRFSFGESIGRSFVYSFKIAGSIFRVIGELFTGKLGITALGGPITTISMTSQIAAMGLRYFLEIAGFIGVNLAVFNLLPIPALDGSKVIFTLIEWIRGKSVNRKVEAIIHTVGLLLLFGFAILVDILQFV